MKPVLVLVFLAAGLPAQRVLFQHVGPVNRWLGWSVRPGGDVDGDGFRDFVVTNREVSGNPADVQVFSGATGARIWLFTNTNQNGGILDALGVGDVDGDGHSDVAVLVHTQLKMFSGRTGSLLYARPPMVSHSYESVCEVGDYNGDGSADLAVAQYFNGLNQIQVLSGANGASLTTLPPVMNNSADAILRLAGDLNADGLQDLALGIPDRVDLLATANPGGLLWTVAQSSSRSGRTLETADLDGDGKREVLVGRPNAPATTGNSGRVEVYEGSTGLPRFVIEMPLDFDGTIGNGLSSIGDLDQDGVVDLCVGPGPRPHGGALAFSGRTGEPLWQFASGPHLRSCGRSIADLGDIDGDGFHEVALGCPSLFPASGWIVLSGKVVADVTRQGGACGAGPFLPELGMTRPVLGQSVTIACRDGAAGATGILALSRAPILPTYLGASTCHAWFDLGSWTILHSTTQAQWSISVPVPGAPQLAGLQVALQCFYAPTNGALGMDVSNGLWARLGY